MAEQNERRVILIGKSGSGKSATGNTILMRKGRKRFPVNSTYGQSTTECSTRQAFNKTMQLNYKVLDTPGLWKDSEALPEVGYLIQQQVIEYCNAPHVFLLVVNPDDSHNTMQIAKVLQTWFGKTILDHTIVVITRGTLFKTDESFHDGVLRGKLDGLVDLFGSRIVRVENHGDGRAKSLQDLLSLIERSSRDGKAIFQFEATVSDSKTEPTDVYCTKPKEPKSVVARYSPIGVGSEAESTEHEYVYGTMAEGESDASSYGSKPLMEKDVKRTIDCALSAGMAMVNMPRRPLISLASLSVMASNEENREAIKNVVQSKEVQSVMETTWSFLTEAATTVGNFVTEVAQEVEKERIRKEREEARRRRNFPR